MEISLSRTNNQFSLNSLSKWLHIDPDLMLSFYVEIENDHQFLNDISQKIEENKDFKVRLPGLFTRAPIDNPDWFGLQRITLYCLTRLLRPELVVETGVYYGGNSAFILSALNRNGKGELVAIDLPQSTMTSAELSERHPWVGDSELYQSGYKPGFIIPNNLRTRLNLVIGDSKQVLKGLGPGIDLFVHDSEHTVSNVTSELDTIWNRMSSKGVVLVDDIDWSNGFFSFVVRNNLYPLLLTDNGKDDLRVRTGLIKPNHPNNNLKEVNLT